MFNPTDPNDTQKIKVQDKGSAHLKPKSTTQYYAVNDPIWFTEDGCPDWKSGIIESVDNHPDSYLLINLENCRRIRRNKHAIKLRIPIESINTNVMSTPDTSAYLRKYQTTFTTSDTAYYTKRSQLQTEIKQATEATLPTTANNPPIKQTQQKPDQHDKTTSPAKTHQIKTKTRQIWEDIKTKQRSQILFIIANEQMLRTSLQCEMFWNLCLQIVYLLVLVTLLTFESIK